MLLRGNHEGYVEGRDKTYVWHRLVEYYKKKRPDMGYFFLAEWMVRSILDVTVYLPLAALINDQIFCAHGGISHRMKLLGGTLDDVFKKVSQIFSLTKNQHGFYGSNRGNHS